MNEKKLSKIDFKTHLPFTFPSFVSIAVLIAIGLFMLFLSWRKWPDLVVDFGSELYVPWQLLQGSVYNKDIVAGFGPFSYYFNSFLFYIFGVNWMVIAVFNMILIIVLTCIIYFFFLKSTDRMSATMTCAVFLGMFAFSQYTGTGNYNFVTPYSHHLSHGIILSFLTIYIFSTHVNKRSSFQIITIGMFLGWVFLTKLEVFIALFLAILFGMFFLFWTEKLTIQGMARRAGMLLFGFLLPSLFLIVFLSQRVSLNEAFSSILIQFQMLSNTSAFSNIFYQKVSGLDTPAANLGKLLLVSAWYMLTIISVTLLGCLLNFIARDKIRKPVFYIIMTALFILAPHIVLDLPFFEIFRPLPLVIFILGMVLFIHLLRIQDTSLKQRNQALSLLVMTIFAFGLLTKMILNTHIYHYGFALALPATLLCVMVFVYHIPNLCVRFCRDTFLLRVLFSSLVVIILLTHIYHSKWIYDKKLFPVGVEGETILTYDQSLTPQGMYYQTALNKIRKLINKDETFVVLPEGTMLNYLARRKNPSPYNSFIPFVIELHGEGKMFSELIKSNPDYVVLLERDVGEFGYEKFGQDSGVKIMKWVDDNYRTVSEIGKSSFSESSPWILIKKRAAGFPRDLTGEILQ